MAASAVDEAIRNSVAVGGSPHRTALLDNFSWGSSHDSQSLGALVRAAEGCYHAAKAYGTPFISGKDSLNNEYEWKEETISIPHTLLISAVSIIENVETAITSDLKRPGNLIYLVGVTRPELGASHYYATLGAIGNHVPKVNMSTGPEIIDRVAHALDQHCCVACHDLSEGGLGVALAEMAIGGSLGLHADLRDVPVSPNLRRNDTVLFSESNSRFLMEVPQKRKEAFESAVKPVPCALIGEVTATSKLIVDGLDGTPVVDAEIDLLRHSWQTPLSAFLR
jgi:phosphoribosylformylglycinamidine synthase